MPPVAAFFVYVWPEPHSSAAGVRTLELAENLRSFGFEPVFFSPCKENDASERLRRAGFATHHAPVNESSVEETLRAFSPALVIYDRFLMEEQMGWRARALWPKAYHLVDTIDLHSIRRARERLYQAGAPWEAVLGLQNADYGTDRDRELASLYRADAALVVSSFERGWLIDQGYPAERAFLLPFGAKPEPSTPPFEERSGFCFLGNFRHPPNLDAVRWLVREIWPGIRAALPKAELCLYGAYPTTEVSQLHGKKGITLHSSVEDHRAALKKHRVLLAALRFGAGLKGKVLESWASGTVTVGTGVAFEGKDFPPAKELVAEAVRAYEDEAEWERRAALGRRALLPFHPEKVREELRSVLAAGAEKEKWRRHPVTRMLLHHQLNATKYFSLWIEEKNKKKAGAENPPPPVSD